MAQQLKIIGINGQISLGKEFASKTVIIDQIDNCTWIIKTSEFIPHTEKWIYEKNHLTKLEKAIDWAEKNPTKDNFKQS